MNKKVMLWRLGADGKIKQSRVMIGVISNIYLTRNKKHTAIKLT
jgi:hypothetical protein